MKYDSICLYVTTQSAVDNDNTNSNGNGQWIDLTDYNDADSFDEACREITGGEDYIFTDFENVPEKLFDETCVSDELWEFVELDYTDRQIVNAYWESVVQNGDIEKILEQLFYGVYEDEEDFAIQYLDNISEIPDNIRNYIDYEKLATDLLYDFHKANVDGKLVVFANY